LGGRWRGTCQAAPAEEWAPGDDALEVCNLGYARGQCARFPGANGPDAVRFAVTGDDGSRVRIHYAAERDHHPFAHGALDYLTGEERFAAAPRGELLPRQAEAYVRLYLRRRALARG
jgi:hypothetical protein